MAHSNKWEFIIAGTCMCECKNAGLELAARHSATHNPRIAQRYTTRLSKYLSVLSASHMYPSHNHTFSELYHELAIQFTTVHVPSYSTRHKFNNNFLIQ